MVSFARQWSEPSPCHDLTLRSSFLHDVLAGLAKPRKSIPAKHLYDARGSALFEKICELDEYYLTRTELLIFRRHVREMAGAIGPEVTVIEPGAGSGSKAAMLLGALNRPRGYVPIEISDAALHAAHRRIGHRFPRLFMQPVRADFTARMPLAMQHHGRKLIFFPGSTIGNFGRRQRVQLWQRFARMLGSTHDGMALVGFDLIKPVSILLPAYNDAQGITAAFNANLLRRINEELAGNLDLGAFVYDCRWNEELACIEMGQRSTRDQMISVADRSFHLALGEVIRTERSHKFTLAAMDHEAAEAGFHRAASWLDPKQWYAVALYRLDAPGRR